MSTGVKPISRKTAGSKVSAKDHDDRADYIELHTRPFALPPEHWQGYHSVQPLTWKHVDFNRASRAVVPRNPGLYAFAVQPPHNDFPPSSWLFYVGEVGATQKPGRTLWKRYGEYLSELDDNVREKVGRMIFKFHGYVRFYYCELDPMKVDIKKVESELITAMWPYANKKDFKAIAAKTRKAFS